MNTIRLSALGIAALRDEDRRVNADGRVLAGLMRRGLIDDEYAITDSGHDALVEALAGPSCSYPPSPDMIAAARADGWLPVSELAREMGLSRASLWRRIKSGRIASRGLGSRVYVRRSS